MSRSDKVFNKAYASEKEAFAAYSNPHGISFYDFKLILKTFFYILQTEAQTTGDVFILPYKLGAFGIRKKPTFGKGSFDYKLFNETGAKRYNKNNHSSQYVAKFDWITKYPLFDRQLPNTVFRYYAPRDMKRALAKRVKDNNTIHKYYDL